MIHLWWQALLFLGLSYLVGAIPFGYLLGRLKGVDIRQQGSGNIGATNLTRVVGRRWGFLCFFLDFLKGAGPVLAAVLSGGDEYFPWFSGAVAIAAVVGHVWPVYLRFKGGKGVATTLGAMIVFAPAAMLAATLVWVVVFQVSRYVSLASMAAACALPLGELLAVQWRPAEISVGRLFLLGALAVFIVLKHRQNIQRLWSGQEHRFNRKKECGKCV